MELVENDVYYTQMDDSKEEGIEQGILQTKRNLVINMLKKKEPIDKICRIVECDVGYMPYL